MKKIVLIALVLSLFLMGCQKAEEPAEEVTTTPETTETPEETTPEISIESEITEIDSLDEDINLDDLEGIESELDEINW